MSSFKRKTFNPRTGEVEEAWWIDDYFGHHQYGVKFNDGSCYTPEEIKKHEFRSLGLRNKNED